MVREMIGGCCVCLDERGWKENPLVYCDGSGCTIAVHQACYGIVSVPSGPWFCCKCQSQERVARVRCELCPQKDGALKRTDTGGWAHVVCALYIPEVRFGDVSTMEPIILSSVPADRYNKSCCICEERNKESGKSHGACMTCHKTGCKLAFHVTCAQSKRQLCEEAGVDGHVQYVGYCTTHWQKRMKLKNTAEKKEKEKKIPRVRTESTSSTNSVELNHRGRKLQNHSLFESENSQDETMEESHSPLNNSRTDLSDEETKKIIETSTPNGQSHTQTSKLTSVIEVNGFIHTNDIPNGVDSMLVTNVAPINNTTIQAEEDLTPKRRKRLKSLMDNTDDEHEDQDDINSNENEHQTVKETSKKRKVDKVIEKPKTKTVPKEKKTKDKDKDKEKTSSKKKKDKTVIPDKKRKLPQPSQLGELENGKVSSWNIQNQKLKEAPDNFQAFLEHQWNQSAQFITSKAQHFDVASLLGCLHQLKSDNGKLEKKLTNLQLRKDRLLGLNARLASSFSEPSTSNGVNLPEKVSLSAMLSKLNGRSSLTVPIKEETCDERDSSPNKKTPKTIVNKSGKEQSETKRKYPDQASETDQGASSDLALLAAASMKHDNRTPTDEKPAHNSSSVPGGSMLVQPNIEFANHSLTASSQAATNRLLNRIFKPPDTSYDTDKNS
ncbi:zinc finger protein zfp-1-like [Clytia hemisphaerica]|uniref:Protein AF-10 n=1 Tax=Clytia hemisphaerica TaxID=252671 RepID=A0A7M5WW46_9CNID